MQIHWPNSITLPLGAPTANASFSAEHKYLFNRCLLYRFAGTGIRALIAFRRASASNCHSLVRNFCLHYFCRAAHEPQQQRNQRRRKRIMLAFAVPLLPRPAKQVPSTNTGLCHRPQPQMTTGTQGVLRWLRGGAAAAAAAAVVHLGACGEASAVGLGVQEIPVRISTFECAEVPRLPVHWELHSQGSDTETFIVIANQSAASVDLLWVNYRGEEVLYATILPGRMHLQPSYATHPWVVRDHASQNSIMFVMAEKDPAIAVVGGEGPEAKATQEEIFRNPLKLAQAIREAR